VVFIVHLVNCKITKGDLLRGYLYCAVFIALFFTAGCATTGDLRRVRGDLDYQIRLTNDKVAGGEQGLSSVRDEVAGIRRELETSGKAVVSLRGNQAEGRAETTEIRDQIQQLRGTIESLRKDLSNATARTTKREEEEKNLREKLDNLAFKINFIENFLGLGKKDDTTDSSTERSAKQPSTLKETAGKGKADKESLYTVAYELFRDAKYEKSREGFENFLKQHPDTEFSDNAQFWIGECYYFEKKYEKAIVEYDKVIKNFPDSNKVPYALLKQGLSFQRLGDKASAKLLMQQVIRDFPNTSQSRIAREKLLEIK
jgi:tol-pal system protein YbgF